MDPMTTMDQHSLTPAEGRGSSKQVSAKMRQKPLLIVHVCVLVVRDLFDPVEAAQAIDLH